MKVREFFESCKVLGKVFIIPCQGGDNAAFDVRNAKDNALWKGKGENYKEIDKIILDSNILYIYPSFHSRTGCIVIETDIPKEGQVPEKVDPVQEAGFIEQRTLFIDWISLDTVLQKLMNDPTFYASRIDFEYFQGFSEANDDECYDGEELTQLIANYLNVDIITYQAEEDGVRFIL